MEFEIETKVLLNALKNINNLISNNINPVLSAVYIKANDDSLILIATNGEISYQQIINGLTIKKPNNILVKAKILYDYLSKINYEKIKIQQIDEKLLEITIPKSCFEINLLDDSSFPILDFTFENEKKIELSRNVLENISNKIKPFTAIYTIEQSSSPTTRILLNSIDSNLMESVSFDNRCRVAYYKFNYVGDQVKFTIENKAIELGLQILPTSNQENLSILITDKDYFLKSENILIKFPIFNEQYPNVLNAILSEQKYSFTIKLKDLIQAINRGSIALNSEKKPIATFKLENNKLTIKFISSQLINSYEEIDVSKSNIDSFECKLNLKYFTPIINTIEGEDLTWNFNGINTAIILSTDNKNLLNFILPVRLI